MAGSINVAQVDTKENRPLSLRFDVKGVPTLLYFHKGRMFVYSGARTLPELTKFVESIRSTGKAPNQDAGSPVPEEPGLFDGDLLAYFRNNKGLAYGILFGVIVLGLFVFFSLAADQGGPSDKKKK